MKRLSVLFVGLLSAVLVFSVAGIADTNKSVVSQLTLQDVIDISLSETSLGVTDITQDGNLDEWNQEGTSTIVLGTFDVQVLTLTNFKVTVNSYSAEWFDSNGDGKGSLTGGQIDSDPLILKGDTTTGAVSWLKDNGVELSGFSGSNNINTAGESVNYDLQVDPSKLTNDYDSGDYLRFDVGFLVEDDSV